MIKLLISSLMMAMLAGCVSPYYSMADSGYSSNEVTAGVPYQDSYARPSGYVQSTAYYPYWSMDYFYLGSHYYRPSYGSSFSISLSSGYPYYGPYFDPGYYSPWYAPYSYYNPWFGTHYAWGGGYGRYDPYWRHGYGSHGYYRSPRYGHSGGYDRGHDSGGYDRGRGNDRNDEQVSGNGGARPGSGYRQGGERGVREPEPLVRDRAGQGRTEPVGTNRNVSLAPSRERTDRGMVVVNRGDGKPRPNRPDPVSRQGGTYGAPPPAPGASPAATSHQSEQSRIVAPNDNKVGRSRTGIPVRSGSPEPAVRVNPGQAVVQSRPPVPQAAPVQRSNQAAPPQRINQAAPPQRGNREPAARSDSRNSNSNSNSDRQAPSDSGDDADRSEQDSGDRPDRGRRRGH